MLADFGPGFQGVQKCWGQLSEVRETWGSIDGGVKKKLLAFRLGIHPQTLMEGRQGAPPDEEVQVQCTLSGDIQDHELTASRTASHITYPGSTCASHISPPPPSPPPAESDEEAEELAETLRQRDGNWGPCDEEDFRCGALDHTALVAPCDLRRDAVYSYREGSHRPTWHTTRVY